MKFAAIFAVFMAILTVNSFSAMKIDSVIADLKNPLNIIDGDFNTEAVGKPGTNVIILQLGNLKYVKELKVYLQQAIKFKYFNVESSENFIEWRNIVEKSDISAATLDFSFENLVSSFIRIVIVSDVEFRVKEIEAFETAAPANRITDVKIFDVGEKTASIRWQTKVKSQGTVIFQKKVNGTRQVLMEADYRSEHSVNLQGLLKGTEYIVVVVSQAPDGTRLESGEYTFRTKGIPLPDIWELKAEAITPFTAKIRYLANIPVGYQVQLGSTEKNLKPVINQKQLKDRGTFEILGLQPETLYYYKLIVRDKPGNVQMTPPIAFKTPAWNIALGKKAVGTFNFVDEDIKKIGYGETKVANVVDGNLNYFGGMAISFNADNSDQYVAIDLNKAEPIQRLDIYWWGLAYSRNYRIDLSNDGQKWTTVVSGLDAENGSKISSPGGDVLVLQSVPIKKTARMVRLYVAAGAKRGTKVTKWEPRSNLYLMEIAVIKDVEKK